MTDHGLNRTERRRRRLRTVSRVVLYVLKRAPSERRELSLIWFYANKRSVGHSRRGAWREAKDDMRILPLVRAVFEAECDSLVDAAEQITREAA